MSTEKFIKAWEQLSPIQREAANWVEGPLVVLAGPGSGKTRVLTCRIAKILESNLEKNFRVLGLTFTNKAADEMRTRVIDFVPGMEGRLFVGTIHSFCSNILRQHGTHLGINPNFRIYSQDFDLNAVLNDAVETAKRSNDLISDIDKKTLPVIQAMKSRLILPENCQGVFKDKRLGERMAIIYPLYEEELAKRNALDFNSLILKTYRLFTTFPSFANRYRTVYPYICIDEFQDTNQAQYKLIRALTSDQHKNLFIVADDDQIIYQWNGASHKRIEEFIEEYSPTIIQLPMNYRCPYEIVELANNLIRNNFMRSSNKKPLEAFRNESGKNIVRLLSNYPDFEIEATEIAKDIKNLHYNHLGSVVVLGRSRKLLERVETALRNIGVPCVISQRKDEFESTPFVWLYSMLQLANDRQNTDVLEAVCGTFSQLTQVDVDPEDVKAQALASNGDYLRNWSNLAIKKPLNDLAKEILDEVEHNLVEVRDFKIFSRNALNWFSKLVLAQQRESSDSTAEVFARYEEERLVWEELFREIIGFLGNELTLEAFLQELQMRSKETPPKPNSVTLMTIHGAKGKEFDHVYLIGLVEDEMPSFQSKRKGDNSPEMEEERRNCFVAITRTIKTLTLSYANRYWGWKKEPSRFLFEMGLLQSIGS